MSEYEERRRRHVDEAFAVLPAYVDRLTWAPERLAAERDRRLRGLVRAAIEGSSWHGRRLGDVDPDRLSEDDLAGLPVMTKDDLMSNFDEIVTDHRVTLERANAHVDALAGDAYLFDDLHAVASGGSSGRRGVFVYGWESWMLAYVSLARHMVRDLMVDSVLADASDVMGLVAAENASHMTSAIPQTFASPLIRTERFPVTLPVDEIVHGLNRLKPSRLGAYASMLPILVSEARAGRLTIAPCRVIATSEPLLPEIRTAAEETWGAPIANMWGTSEGGGTGVGCYHGPGLHLADDLLIVEPVDESGTPVPPGVRSAKVYLTNLYNHVLPLIRYEIEDQVVVLDEPCPCGSTHRRVADIEGRADDCFAYADGVKIHPHVFRSPLGRKPHILEYQVRQTARGADIAVCCSADPGADDLRAGLEAELAKLGLRDPLVTITRVDRLDRQSTGKLRRFVPLSAVPA